MIKPERLQKGDTIAIVSPSWGICGDKVAIPKYKHAMKYFEKELDINIISAPNSMRGEKYLKENPKARADDLIWTLENNNIKGILSTMGGNDSINILPFIDLNIIKNNPKIFIGSSDIFYVHALFLKAGVVSFYGGNLLTSLTNSIESNSYSNFWLNKTLFNNEVIEEILPPKEYSYNKDDIFSEKLEYTFYKKENYRVINGKGIVRGKLIICTTELMTIQETEFNIPEERFENSILCIEDIVECVSPQDLFDFIVWLYEKNILQKVNSLVIAKFNEYPQNFLYEEVVVKVLNKLSMEKLPVLYGLDFGHTLPKITLPYGVLAEIDLDKAKFFIIENAVS